MARQWLSSPVGIHTPDSFSTVQESVLDWASESDYLPASAGVGTVGDTIGTTVGESNTTTTRTFRIAGPSLIAIVSTRHERTSTMRRIQMAEMWVGSRGSIGPTTRTFQQ